ncbi:hypothetical protein ACFR97_00855 [Haloplanus litoreus]|uniref:DUF7344 domain-containing protein n=1 Tax=Haloplanus litoreus TaxID=767515 RepID=A0ABD5ZV77_9EURY
MTTSNVNPDDDLTADETGGNRTHGLEDDRLDALFGVLADARRRRVIRILEDADAEVMAVSTLAEALAAREQTGTSPDRLVVSLRHVHLPRLDAVGIVDFEPDRSQVRYKGAPVAGRLLEQL